MKKFLRKLAFYLISLSIILMCTDLMIHPKFAGRIFNEKFEHYSDNSHKYDLVFFGSSQTYRQFIPDTLTAKLGISSFNYGVPGYIGFNRNTMFEQLFENGHFDNTRYILMEMGNYLPLKKMERQMRTRRGRFFFSWSSYYDHLLFINNLDIRLSSKIKAFLRLTKIYIKSRIKVPGFDFLRNQLNLIPAESILFMFESHGYMPFDFTETDIFKRHETFKNSLEELKTLRTETESIRNRDPEINKALSRPYKKWIDKFEKKGIQLIWVLNPLITHSADSSDEFYYLKSIFNQLPERNRIDLGDPIEYPFFYSEQNLFDTRHLNNDGAKLYSKYLAEELGRIIHPRPPYIPSKFVDFHLKKTIFYTDQ